MPTWKTGTKLVRPDQVQVGDKLVHPYSSSYYDEKVTKVLEGGGVYWLIGENGSELEYWPGSKVRIRKEF